jgi:hypothetical protein
VAFPELGDIQNVTSTVFRLDNGGTAALRMDYLQPASIRVKVTTGRKTGIDRPAVQGSVFEDFLLSTYLGAKPALTWQALVRANE